MIPIVSIVGRSNSGKTTFITRLVPELRRRGYRVATVKHTHGSFDMDHEGTDSKGHKDAGAHTVVVSSPEKVAVIADVSRDLTLSDLAGRFIREAHLIVAEGFKRDTYPKVEVFRQELHAHPLAPELQNVIAVVSDVPVQADVPCHRFDDVAAVADIIERRVIHIPDQEHIDLWVDGAKIPLSSFPKKMIIKTVEGLLSSLKGCTSPEDIEVRIHLAKRR